MKKMICVVVTVFCFLSFSTLYAENNSAKVEERIIPEPVKTASSILSVYDGAKTVSIISQSSGPGIMTTLANGTSLVRGVGCGTSAIGYFAGNGTADILNKTVFAGNTRADEAARTGTKVGAVVGTAGSAVVLASAGAGPAGLSAVGSFVGGGMATGAIAVVAAPAAAAVAVGALFYWMCGD